MTDQDSGTVTHGETPLKVEVTSLGGQKITLMRKDEKKFYEDARAKYQSEYTFTMTNDKRALDRLLLLETQAHRYAWWQMAGQYYDGTPLESADERDLHRRARELEPMIAQIQSDLGLTKAKREQSSHNSVGEYITQLKVAAKEHGVMREKQLGKAIELTKELFAISGAWSRSNAEERRKLPFQKPEEIIQWVMEYMKPEFDLIDAEFRDKQARFYRRRM